MRAIAAVDTGAVGHQGQDGRQPAAVPTAGRKAAVTGVMVYGHANGGDIAEHTVDEPCGAYIDRRLQGHPGPDRHSGASRTPTAWAVASMFYEPADAALPSSEHGWDDAANTLNYVPKLFDKRCARRGTASDHPPAARRATTASQPDRGRPSWARRWSPIQLVLAGGRDPGREPGSLQADPPAHDDPDLAVGEIFNTIWDCQGPDPESADRLHPLDHRAGRAA